MKRSRGLRISVVIGLCALFLGQGAFGQTSLAQKKTLMIFPYAIAGAQGRNPSDAVTQFSSDLFSLVGDGLAANRAYSVIKFEPRIASIRRAVKEQKIEEKEVLSPIDTDPAGKARAQKLAKLTGTDLAVLGSIDKYAYKAGRSQPGQPATPGQVDMGATLLLIDVSSGKELYRFIATGQSVLDDPNELAIGTAATYDLAEKLLTDINKITLEVVAAGPEETTQAPVVVVTHTRKSGRGLLPAMIGAALLGLLIGGK